MKHAPHPGRFFRRIHPLPMHDSPVTIRHYRLSDLPLLRQITVESFGGVSLDQSLEQKLGLWNERDWKARKADHIDDDVTQHPEGCFVAERDGEILGYITTRLDHLNSRGRIPNLAVVEAARGLGLGRRLIVHALDHMREAGMKVAQIETMASNAIGQHLYPSCGFEEVALQVHFAMRL
jgi:ribosomal protein S18 acetylase RimI-like enzyme